MTLDSPPTSSFEKVVGGKIDPLTRIRREACATAKMNPRIQRQYSIIAHSPDCVELRSGVWNPVSFTLVDATKSGRLFTVLNRLDGSVSPSEISHQEAISRTEVEAVLDQLRELGVLESGATTALEHYIDSTIPTLANPQRKEITPSPIILMGASAVTREIDRYLRQSLPDSDISVVSEEDPALVALSNSDTSWLTNGIEFQEKLSIFEKWRGRFLVFAVDVINPIFFRIANRVCLELQLPWIHAALDGPFLFIGPLFIPGRSSCYECFETRVTMNLRESASYQRYKQALAQGNVKLGSMPIQPTLVGVLASVTAMEVLNYSLTRSAFTVQKVLAIYLPTMEFSFNEVLRIAGCPACGPGPGRDDKELYFDMRALLRL